MKVLITCLITYTENGGNNQYKPRYALLYLTLSRILPILLNAYIRLIALNVELHWAFLLLMHLGWHTNAYLQAVYRIFKDLQKINFHEPFGSEGRSRAMGRRS